MGKVSSWTFSSKSCRQWRQWAPAHVRRSPSLTTLDSFVPMPWWHLATLIATQLQYLMRLLSMGQRFPRQRLPPSSPVHDNLSMLADLPIFVQGRMLYWLSLKHQPKPQIGVQWVHASVAVTVCSVMHGDCPHASLPAPPQPVQIRLQHRPLLGPSCMAAQCTLWCHHV